MLHQAYDHNDTRGRSLTNLSLTYYRSSELQNEVAKKRNSATDFMHLLFTARGLMERKARGARQIRHELRGISFVQPGLLDEVLMSISQQESEKTASYEPVKKTSSTNNRKVESKLYPSATRPRSKFVKEHTSTRKPETRFQVYRGEAVGRVSNPDVEDSF